jgi:hypothetical protein
MAPYARAIRSRPDRSAPSTLIPVIDATYIRVSDADCCDPHADLHGPRPRYIEHGATVLEVSSWCRNWPELALQLGFGATPEVKPRQFMLVSDPPHLNSVISVPSGREDGAIEASLAHPEVSSPMPVAI